MALVFNTAAGTGGPNGEAFVRFWYDDADAGLVCTQISVQNTTPSPLYTSVINAQGQALNGLSNRLIAPGTAETFIAVPQNRRFNVETEAPSVSLGGSRS